MISNNIIRYSKGYVIDSYGSGCPEIVNNYIYDYDGSIGVLISSNAKIHDNILNGGHGWTIYLNIEHQDRQHVEITNNTITSLGSDIYGNHGCCILIDVSNWGESDQEILIYKNDMTNDMTNDSINSNIISLRLEGDVNFENLNFVQNNLRNTEGVFSAYLEGYNYNKTLNMTNNWWGTTDEAVINQLIYDDNDDFNLPTVNYQPIATEEISDAGSSLPPIFPHPPVADAGPDQIVFDTITLDGSLSSDLDGDPLTYEWSIQHTVNPDHDHAATGQVITITGLALGFYNVILTVTDATGAIDTDTMFFSATGPKGDFDFDGDVDGDDLVEFSENFGM